MYACLLLKCKKSELMSNSIADLYRLLSVIADTCRFLL